MGDSNKSVFSISFECSALVEDIYEVVLEKISDELYSDGNRFYIFTESFVYVSEAKKDGKTRKKVVAKRKGKNLVLSGTKDQIVFNPDVVLRNTNSFF